MIDNKNKCINPLPRVGAISPSVHRLYQEVNVKKVKVWILDSAASMRRLMNSSALQSWKWQLIGMG